MNLSFLYNFFILTSQKDNVIVQLSFPLKISLCILNNFVHVIFTYFLIKIIILLNIIHQKVTCSILNDSNYTPFFIFM